MTLQVVDLEVEYRHTRRVPVRAVAGVSLRVEPGQIVGLVGESGCGKSTLARAAVGLVKAQAGAVQFCGEDVRLLGRRARPLAQVRLQLVFQDPYSSLNPRRTIGAQIMDGLRVSASQQGKSTRRRDELLSEVGLAPSAADRYPHQFSGGQQQRIAIARALAANPTVMVLDEPFSALDASVQAQLANLLTRLAKSRRIGMLVISHDLGVIRQISDVVAVMYLGKIVESGPTGVVWDSPQHPYTQALIRAIPRTSNVGTLPGVLAGEVPDPRRPPNGCRFHPRCPHVLTKCKTDEPHLSQRGSGIQAACWLPTTGNQSRDLLDDTEI